MPDRTEVLIVGAGPVGLVLACGLRRRDVPCRVIDRHREFPSTSRANALLARPVEILDGLGLVERLQAAGYQLGGLRAVRGSVELARFEGMFNQGHPAPSRPHRGGILINQAKVEEVLRAKLAELGGEVRLGQELRGFEEDADGLDAEVADRESGAVRQIRATWLVGCDGARSTVRELLGLAFEGKEYPDQFVQADVLLDGDLPRGLATAWLNERGMMTGIPFREPGLWRLIAKVHPDADGNFPQASVELFQRMLVERAGDTSTRIVEPRWLSNFAVHHRIVDRYKKGRVLVAGDAAHLHSPIGGQGLNTGLQDSYNLGWKLALVVTGTAPTELLDTYGQERRPAGRKTLRETDANHRMRVSGLPLSRTLLDRVVFPLLRLPAVQRRVVDWLMKRNAQLDVEYRSSVLSEQAGDMRKGPEPGDRSPNGRLLSASGESTSLFEHFRDPNFRLLLFQGRRDGVDLATLAELGRRARGATDGLVRPIAILGPTSATSDPEDELTVLRDPGHRTHDTYGASAPALFLVRPDGHIGLRAPFCEESALIKYLHRHLQLTREVDRTSETPD